MKSAPFTSSIGNIPSEGQPQEIFPGLFWLRMPLPFELSHINLWLMEDTHGWTIVDTGFNFGDTMSHWENVFSGTFKNKPVEDIFITHFHPDHFGLAGWLAARTDVIPRMTAAEYAFVRALMDGDSLKQLYRPYYIEAGVSGEILEQLIQKRLFYKKIIAEPPEKIAPVALDSTLLLGGRDWKIIGGGGHSPAHACLYNARDKIFIAGDVVLPGITPNISFFPGNEDGHNPLADYFSTLETVKNNVPDDVTILPSHGEPFQGLHRRIAEIRQHHEKRLRQIEDICAAPKTAYQVMEALFSHRKLEGTMDMFFALGETLAHLVYAEKTGIIKKTIQNGIASYSIC